MPNPPDSNAPPTAPADAPGYCECDAVTDASPLCQGDVFSWLDQSTSGQWGEFGIIITADCDLARQKHSGRLSFVPVLQLSDYLRNFVVPRRIHRASRPVWEKAVALVHQLQAANLEDFPKPVSIEAFREWVAASEPEELISDLAATGAQADDLRSLVTVLRQSSIAEDSDLEVQIETLIALQTQPGRTRQQLEKAFWSEIRGNVRALPGDCFFLNALTNEHSHGYVAYLRLVREISQEQLAITPRDLSNGAALAQRFARLKAPFVYRLTQQLSEVFAAIGLPDDYEAGRERTVDALAGKHSMSPMEEV